MSQQTRQTLDTTLINTAIKQAFSALNAGRADDARTILDDSIARGQANAALYLAQGLVYRALGDLSAAQGAADRSLSLEAQNPRALLLKAELYLAGGKKRAAAAFYGEALALIPRQNTPPDLAAEASRAQAQMQALQKEFATYLSDFVAGDNLPPSIIQSVNIMMGKERIYHPQPRQYYFPNLPIRPFYDPADFDWIADLEAQTDDMVAEVEAAVAAGASFDAYVQGEEDRPNQDSHGMKGNMDWGSYYLWYNGEPVADHQAQCPKTVAALQQIPLLFSGRRSPNVMFSRLKAGAKIPPHTGMVNTRLICHLPLIVPEGCGFRVGNDTRHWEKGKVWLFDDTIEHEAWNTSKEDRIILLFEVWKPELTPAEQDAVTALFKTIDAY